MYFADSPRPSGRKRFAAIAAAVAIGATALVGAVSLQSANAASVTPSECTSNASDTLVTNPFNSAEKFLPRTCTIAEGLAEGRANVFSKDPSSPTFLDPKVQVGYVNGGEEQTVYCQKSSTHLIKGNPWWVLTQPDTDGDNSDTTPAMTAASAAAKNTGWVSAIRFKERYVANESNLPVPGVPNCNETNELDKTDLSGDTLAEYQAKHPTNGMGNGTTASDDSSNQTTGQPASAAAKDKSSSSASKCVSANKTETYNKKSFPVQTCTSFTYRTSLGNTNYANPVLYSFNGANKGTKKESVAAGSVNVVCQLTGQSNPVTYNKATDQKNENDNWLLVADRSTSERRWIPATELRQGGPGEAIKGANGVIADCGSGSNA